jgi:hypothetical protein
MHATLRRYEGVDRRRTNELAEKREVLLWWPPEP